jgi:hypothetical protein
MRIQMPSRDLTIAILGGTGDLGSALAKKWAQKGYRIIIGSRSKEKATSFARSMREELDLETINGFELAEAAKLCDLAVLTVPYSSHETILKIVKEHLQGKILVDTTVPLQKEVTKVSLPKTGSVAVEAQNILGDDVTVIAALQNIGSHLLNSDDRIDAEVLISGNNEAALNLVTELVGELGLRSWHVGPLENSAAAEALTSILISINKKYKRKSSGIKITSH